VEPGQKSTVLHSDFINAVLESFTSKTVMGSILKDRCKVTKSKKQDQCHDSF